MSVLGDAGFCQKTPQIPVFADKTLVLGGGYHIYRHTYVIYVYTQKVPFGWL